MGKKMVINSDVCDARKVTEETLSGFESIVINSDLLLVNDRARALLGNAPMIFNGDRMLDVEGDVHIISINGSSKIGASDAVPEGKQFLTVNGSLTLEPGTEKILETYVGMSVNGSVTYPASLSGYMSRATVNGSTICYPDGAVILKSNTSIDRIFALRAKNNLYWTRNRLIMVDPQLNPEALKAKGARFQARQVILTESLVEGVIDLIDENADIVVVPDGVKVIADDIHLDQVTVKRYGTMLYILGDVKILEEDRDALEAVTYLNIRGDVRVDNSLRDLLLEKAEVSGEIRAPRGRVICNQITARVNRWLLEKEPQGICVENCASVKLDSDIPNDLILERLTVLNAASVSCTEEQESAVGAVCENCAAIGSNGASGILDMVKARIEEHMGGTGLLDAALNTKVINSDYYVM